MGSVDLQLARDLRDGLGLVRAIETGTYRGRTARALATVFESVVTIEVSPELAAAAAARLRDCPAVQVRQGHSVRLLTEARDTTLPTLYFLDGHWSGGVTGGEDDECPVLEELRVIGRAHTHDCFVIDDARLFASAPPPPHRSAMWPELTDVIDQLRDLHPGHVVTVLNDQLIAVPRAAKPALDAYGQRIAAPASGAAARLFALVPGALERIRG